MRRSTSAIRRSVKAALSQPLRLPYREPPQTDQSDPFAEWEKANAKAESQRSSSYAAKAMGADAPKYTPPVRQTAPQRRPAAEAQNTARPAAQPAQSYTRPAAQPAQTAQPVQQPVRQSAPAQPKPAQPAAPAKSSTDFDLDDILNEFK